MRQRRLRQEEHSKDIGLERAAKLVLIDVGQILVVMLLAGVVDDDVELAELINGLSNRILAELLVSDVAGNRDRPAPFLLDDLLRLQGVIMLAEVKNGDVRTLASEQCRNATADAAVRTRDQCDLSVQPA
jgi:hypothetical protein